MQQKIHVTEKGLEELNSLDYEKYGINKGYALIYVQTFPLNQQSYELTIGAVDGKEALLAIQQRWIPVLGSDDHY
ncbi:hypothetical protein [Peribacillus frigoritolerans]|uniref:hypothetical protein n=1 Tax=Peribacillus frigoritolerans TaxID=450367 RepID=UPI00203C938F|nr:hypothetical protein [Peribacillus frigoritolerans]MCM3168665.1 hypothetical protein [Peribacillus frigoritolerans]